MFFRNRALLVQTVKADKNAVTEETVECNHPNLEKIDEIAKGLVKYTSIAIVGTFAAITVLRTVSQIAINAAPKR